MKFRYGNGDCRMIADIIPIMDSPTVNGAEV